MLKTRMNTDEQTELKHRKLTHLLERNLMRTAIASPSQGQRTQ